MASSDHTLDAALRALADGTRRGMLELLSRHEECTAGELGAPFAISQPSASRHIRILERAGLVIRRVEGRQRWFRLNPVPLATLERWLLDRRESWLATGAHLRGGAAGDR